MDHHITCNVVFSLSLVVTIASILSCSALEGLDSLLLRASRNDPGASIDSMKAKITTALNALDRSKFFFYLFLSALVIIDCSTASQFQMN